MKILHVTNLYPYEDHETYGVFVKEQIDSLNKYCTNDVFFINARKYGIRAYLSSITDLWKLIENYEIIHCHHQFCGLIFILNLKSFKKKKILSILGDIEKRNFLNRLIFKFVYNFFDFVIFKNNPPFENNKFLSVPNGVDFSLFKEIDKKDAKIRLGLEEKKNLLHVLFVSNGDIENPIKRFDIFRKVLEELNTSCEYIFKPIYLCNVKREKVVFYFNAADFMILCSDHEGSPNAIKEAMACNLPIVSTPVGDVKELFEGVKNCYITDDHKINSIVERCMTLDFTKKSNGREKLLRMRLDTDSVAEKLLEYYNN